MTRRLVLIAAFLALPATVASSQTARAANEGPAISLYDQVVTGQVTKTDATANGRLHISA